MVRSKQFILKILKYIKYPIFLGLSSFIIYKLFEDIDIEEFIKRITEIDYFYFFLSLVLSLLGFYLRALRWHLIVEVGDKSVSKSKLFFSMMIGYGSNLILSRLGDIIRCSMIYKVSDSKFPKLMGTVIAERLIDLVSLILFTITAVLLNGSLFGGFIAKTFINPLIQKIQRAYNENLLLFLGYIIGIVIIIGLVILLVRLFYRYKKKGNVKDFIDNLVKGMYDLFKIKNKGYFFGLTLLIWISYIFTVWAILQSISSLNFLGVSASMFIVVISSIAMILPAPGGIGTFHYFIASSLAIFGVEAESHDGLFFATVTHESQILVIILTSLVGFVAFTFFYNKKRKKSL